MKSPLYIEAQINIPFQYKQFNLHCIIRSSVFHTEILPMPYKVNLSNEVNCQINEAVSNRNKSPDLNVIEESCLMIIFLFVCFAAISLLSHFWLLQKKCLTSDKGDHNTTIRCTAGLF